MAYSGYASAYSASAVSVWQDLNQLYGNLPLPQVIVYSDGACPGNGQPLNPKAGWGLYFPYPFEHFSTGGRVLVRPTNQEAELTAIYEAICRAPASHHVLIYTDSQFAIDCLTKWITGWESHNYIRDNRQPVINQEILKKIMEARRRRPTKVELKHVPAHSGDFGNTRADEIAKKGAQGYYG